MLWATLLAGILPLTGNAGFSLPSGSSSPGDGISVVLSGSVVNGGIYWQSSTNWLNSGAPAKPYIVTNYFTLPVCDSISVARILTTVWAGTANYTCQMTVCVNGINLPLANPLVFGTTSDTNAEFSATTANAYGSGSGVWLVTIPVPGELLFKNGASNSIVITQTTPDSFDGRIHHVTLVGVYRNNALTNTLDYAIAEGSGDIFRAPTGAQVSQRTIVFTALTSTNAVTANLIALYTYGDTSQNDRLYFNGMQSGGDNVAQWDTSIASYGPSIATFDVLNRLVGTNTLTFSVGSDVPATAETTLRPQFAALAVTRVPSASAPSLSIVVRTNWVQLAISGETNRPYRVLTSTNLANWTVAVSFLSSNAVSHLFFPATNQSLFFRVSTP